MKIKYRHNLLSGLCVPFMFLLLSGCSGKSPTVTYYSLASLDQESLGATPLALVDVGLGVGPVTVPESLKKPQIATRVGNTRRYQFDEFHRWAGIIEKDIAVVIGNNLGTLLGVHKISFFPWLHYFDPDYRVVVELIQFDSDLNGDAILSARWAIIDSSGEKTLASGKSDYNQTLVAPTYDALVDAENMLLGEFSRELAGELKVLALQK